MYYILTTSRFLFPIQKVFQNLAQLGNKNSPLDREKAESLTSERHGRKNLMQKQCLRFLTSHFLCFGLYFPKRFSQHTIQNLLIWEVLFILLLGSCILSL